MAKVIKLAFCLTVIFGSGRLLFSDSFLWLTAAQSASVDFRRDIEPIFRANCYQCHGAKMASAQLRLDVKATAMKGGISGAVIVPKNSRESRLLKRILGEGGEVQMPLGGEPLKSEQIELIRKWIDEGAEWPEDNPQSAIRNPQSDIPKHWAFVAAMRPALPPVKTRAWVRNPIDQFILARIEKQGLSPSPEASRETLIRRLSLDLTGLPASIKEIDDFLADNSPDAYAKLVERLLASPHYGERWGRWWLDAARYADTNGFEKDLPRSIWPYRDWVIAAFNKDLPFDQFTIEQLAGDLLPDPTLEQRVATGFLRNSMLNQEGGVDPEQFRVEGLIDRVDAIGKAFLGLTINCAQCHTHKFDPIVHHEYYQFYAFLNSDDEPVLEVPDEAVTKKRAEILSKIDQIETDQIAKTPDLAKRMAEWELGTRYDEGQWTVLNDTDIFAAFGVKFDKLPDGSFHAKGDNSTSNNYKITARTQLKNITGFRLEFLTDANLPRGGPGRADDGGFYVTEFSADAAPSDKPAAAAKVVLSNPTTDFELSDFPVKNVIDDNPKTHWSSDAGPGRRNEDRKMVFAASQPIGFEGGTVLTFQLAQKFDEKIDLRGGKPNIGRFRISVTTAANPNADPLPAKVRRILAAPADKRARAQQREVFRFYRSTVPEWAEVNKKVAELLKEWPYGATTLALAPRQWPRETHLFRRGDWKRPGDPVKPGTPAILHPFPQDAPRNRLGLARWIVDKSNPLTPRVIVNRIWQQYFGTGLVTTPEDFGSRCEKPSHPELLDWLANEFMNPTWEGEENKTGGQGDKGTGGIMRNPQSAIGIQNWPQSKGWSIKHIHRLIVNSAVYRQSSKVNPALQETDPANILLARAPRLRVEAEIVRDIALTTSGLLSRKIGGPSVYPPIPDGVLNLGYGAPMPWPTSTGEDRYRRTMYTFWKRSVPYPGLLVFDQPNGDFSCTRRIRSNTPLQALTTLNDQMFIEAAQALALRVFKEGGADDRAKMIYAFRICTGRKPDEFELRQLLALLQDQQAYFNGRTATAVYVSSSDLNNLPEDVDLHKVASWTMVARVLLNLDETITRE
ncbi:MAG: PSD1 and planctomycete cytochrome C domain-containing protein [Acidobacteria bacterium]|nr:PSD1 and planctomycete cytochrome C domain-containing protein [Acidobacteriota bacterium]